MGSNFNPTWPDDYKPTSSSNDWNIANDVGQYSDSSDTVTSVPGDLLGRYILMHGGNDKYTGTDSIVSGWDNIVNGNKGSDTLLGKGNSRDFLRGGKDDDTIEGKGGGDDFLLGDAGNDKDNK